MHWIATRIVSIAACASLWQVAPPESAAWDAAMQLKTTGKSVEGAAAFEAYIQAYPTSERVVDAMVEAGVCWFAAGNSRQMLYRNNPPSIQAFNSALKYFKQVAVEHADSTAAARANFMIGSTEAELGDLAAAEAAYTTVLEKYKSDEKYYAKSRARRATVRRHLMQSDLALEDLRTYMKETPIGSEDYDFVSRHLRYATLWNKPALELKPEAWVQGGPFTMATLKGQVVAFFFFASWCENCAKEQPFLQDLFQRYQGAGFQLIGVVDHTKGQTTESVAAHAAGHGIPYPIMMDSANLVAQYKGSKIPDLVLIDRWGRVRWHDHPSFLTEYTIETLLTEEADQAHAGAAK